MLYKIEDVNFQVIAEIHAPSFAQAVQKAVKLGASLRRANLYDAKLYWCDFRGANFERAYLIQANMAWSDLRGAKLTGAIMVRTNLYCCNLRGADRSGADMDQADVTGAVY